MSKTLTPSDLDILFKSRRSHYPKHFSGEEVDDDVVEQILQYACLAPTHKKTKPWRFQIFKGEAKNNLIDETKKFYLSSTPKEAINKSKLEKFEVKKHKTSHILAILVKINSDKRVPEVEEISATACAVENIYLALPSFGLGGYWSTGKFTYALESREHLKLASDEILLGYFYLGTVKDPLPSNEMPDIKGNTNWVKA